MKLLIIIICLSIGIKASAQNSKLQKPFLESVLEEMTKQYIQSAVKDAAIKELEKIATEALAKEMTGVISSSLAVIGLVENVQAYEKASLESERYRAFSQAAANITTLFNPAVGTIVQLDVLAQDLSAAFISKDFQLKTAQIIAEITKIEKLRSEIILAEYEKEKEDINIFFARVKSIEVMNKNVGDAMSSSCSKNKDEDVIDPASCFNQVFLNQLLLLKQINTISEIMNYNGRFFNAPVLGMKQSKKKLRTILIS